MKNAIIDYFTDELKINQDSLRAYELPMDGMPDEVKSMREIEAIKLRDRISQLSTHIAVIKRMFPTYEPPKEKKRSTRNNP